MKTLTYTDSGRIINRERDFSQHLKPTTLLRRFQRYIETSDWDDEIIRKEHLINSICLVAVILSGLFMSPLLISTLLK